MLTHPRFWSLLPSTTLDWVVIIVSVSPSIDAPKHANTSRECYLEYFARRPHRTDLLSVGACEHYSGCTRLHLRKRIATGATHHPPAWHTSHMYVYLPLLLLSYRICYRIVPFVVILIVCIYHCLCCAIIFVIITEYISVSICHYPCCVTVFIIVLFYLLLY